MDQGSRTKDPEDREEEEARGGIEHQRDNNEIINVLCTTSLPFHINVRSTIDDTYKLRERRRRSRRGIGYQQRNSNVNIVCSLFQLIATKYIRSSITLELNNGIAESKYYRKIRKEEKERSQRDRGKNHRQRDRVREVTLSELRDSIARLRERVKLVCRTRGSPPPRVHWLKDGVPLHPRRGLRIQHKRRRSKVVISSAKPEDSGKYECVAESTSGHRASLAAQLLVAHDTKIPETTTAAWPRQEQPCPMSGDFCMNGGTCLFFETVGEPACRCAEGFTGLRCETKDVISTGSVYNRRRVPFSCKLGLSTSYYC